MRCQYPITKGVAPRCKNKAQYQDTDGRVYCDQHGTRGLVRLPSKRAMQKAKAARDGQKEG